MPATVWFGSGTNIKESLRYKYDRCGNIDINNKAVVKSKKEAKDMKHKFKIISIVSILCCIICLYATGCKTRYWTINHPIEDITQILIIVENPNGEDTTIELDKQFYEECINDILNLEAYRYFPTPTHPSGNLIKIIFSNGEYDIIALMEPQHWKLDNEGNISCRGFSGLCFNEEPFNQLIEKWSNYKA